MRYHLSGAALVAAALALAAGGSGIASAQAGHGAAGSGGRPAVAAAGLAAVPGAAVPGAAVPGAAGPGCVSVVGQGPRAALTLHQPRAARRAHAAAGALAVTHTLTVDGTGIAGKPASAASGDLALVFNVDDSSRFDSFPTSVVPFTNGVAKFQLPPGHYFVVGDFFRELPKQQSYDEYLDVLPQYTVDADTTLHLTAKAATSPVQVAVPRRSVAQYETFQLVRSAVAGPRINLSWMVNNGGPGVPQPTLYVSPTRTAPATGELASVTSAQLGSAAFPSNSHYLYDLAWQASGSIPAQHHVVRQAALATASDTVWTWRSAPATGARVPAGWTCQAGSATDRSCQVQPMMTLRYAVAGLGLSGATAAGQQTVRIIPGHLQLASAAKVTGVTVSVSFDGGKTWRAAQVTKSSGGYTARFRAAAGSKVTLRTSATDAVGGSITETITNAYEAGS